MSGLILSNPFRDIDHTWQLEPGYIVLVAGIPIEIKTLHHEKFYNFIAKIMENPTKF